MDLCFEGAHEEMLSVSNYVGHKETLSPLTDDVREESLQRCTAE